MTLVVGALNPHAIEWGPIIIHWYGVIIVLGMGLAIYLSSKEAKRNGFGENVIEDLILWLIPIGLLGARLYYVLFKWEYYVDNPGKIFAIWEGGLAIYGGLIAGALTVYLFAKKKNISIWHLLDILAPGVLLAQGIGRWGNFINQEAFGGPVTRVFLEGLYLPEFIINQMQINGMYYHPTFLYESLWSLAGFVILLILRRKPKFLRHGEVLLSYVIWYSAGRFFIEGMRLDSLWIGDFLRVSQGLSLVLFVSAIVIWFYRRRNSYRLAPYYH